MYTNFLPVLPLLPASSLHFAIVAASAFCGARMHLPRHIIASACCSAPDSQQTLAMRNNVRQKGDETKVADKLRGKFGHRHL
ncbi:hypothetical protein TVAG_334630 [Trichomonas vaginalis G3]|uniref:Uncharacterized protein n=1 Tax=Trichomonas vaginalis (strain ATCC PRA-98 / G3) TaxID=412133 RepID=A2GHM3_TRIV3|nr:hypothetical protein TVAG_334630 [Trichomonas vaginalis G3]|eukprot:XP_001296277.1 hypothetical protein [Trichomonas vaginalis G3]